MKNNNKNVVFDTIHGAQVKFPLEFKEQFPLMTELLEMAKVVEFTIGGNQRFRQYIWVHNDGTTSGWLCCLEHCVPQGRNIIPEHILLSKNVGGIIDYWSNSKSKETFIDANTFTFSLVNTFKGIGGFEDDYIRKCEVEEINPLDIDDFVTFALEKNGCVTAYNYKTKEVFMYLMDGYTSFAFSVAEGHPEYTLHQLHSAKNFVEYVEELASQWLHIVKE